MLVDDEVPFVQTMAKRLSKRNIKTITAFNAEEGLEKLKENQDLDVIILDIKMPGMDGIDALKEIKTASPLVEVIMLTGHATIESAIEAMKLGAHDFLMKPFDIEELVLKINEAAEKKRQHEKKIEEAFRQETLSKYGPFYYT
jgi:DNA-binding NtrC family response regulator